VLVHEPGSGRPLGDGTTVGERRSRATVTDRATTSAADHRSDLVADRCRTYDEGPSLTGPECEGGPVVRPSGLPYATSGLQARRDRVLHHGPVPFRSATDAHDPDDAGTNGASAGW